MQMLRQHIHWDVNDQQLFDQISDRNSPFYPLDDMTQKVFESERRDKNCWDKIYLACRQIGLKDIYDIDGIEQWIGEDDR